MRINLGRFVTALLFTIVVCLLLSQAQAQTSYNTESATVAERLFMLDLWDQLDVLDSECLSGQTVTALRDWCGAISGDTAMFFQVIIEGVARDHGLEVVGDGWSRVPLGGGRYYMHSAGFGNFDYLYAVHLVTVSTVTFIDLAVLDEP